MQQRLQRTAPSASASSSRPQHLPASTSAVGSSFTRPTCSSLSAAAPHAPRLASPAATATAAAASAGPLPPSLSRNTRRRSLRPCRASPSPEPQQPDKHEPLTKGNQPLTSETIARVTKKSMEELQSKVPKPLRKVAYQGCPGAYSEVAALQSCPDFDPLPCEQFETAFQALSQWLCDRAVLPVENSLGGSIHTVFDLLLRYRLHVVGEVSLGINHCLMALPGSKMEDITRVISHPQALAQCDGYIRQKGLAREAVDDTAGAAQMVADQGLRGTAAIASSRAAQLYGLDILDRGIQDDKENVTRFVVLSRDPLITFDNDPRPYKTSVVFSLGDGPGQLFKALAVFSLRELDLLKIESRPLRSNPLMLSTATGNQHFNYLFYVDFCGKLCEERVQNAMRNLQEIAPFVRVLGSFPMDTNLGRTDVQTVLDSWKQ